MFKSAIILLIFTANFCHSTYIKPEESTVFPTEISEDLDVLETTLQPQSLSEEIENEIEIDNLSSPAESTNSAAISDSETNKILTGDLFKIKLTIKREWNDDYMNRNSLIFQELSNEINTELISFFDNKMNIENSISRENFILKNVLPSSQEGYVYATLLAEATEHVTGQIIHDKLDSQLRVYKKIYEIEMSEDGFEVDEIKSDEVKELEENVECDNAFCKPVSLVNTLKRKSSLSSQEDLQDIDYQSFNQCQPNDKFSRGSTSVFIFEKNEKCMESVKKRSLGTKCNKFQQKNQSGNSTSEDEDLDVAASEVHAKSMSEKDDEVIVVVRKRGDKVFIEI